MLKDVFDRILGYLPRYFEAVGLVLSRPVSEVSARAAEPAFLKDALVFWLISQSLATATRFIAYNADAEEAPYFLANFIVSAVTMAVVSAAFFWTWRLFAKLSFGAVAAAVAYLWGALSPIAAEATPVKVESWTEAVAAFERDLLRRLYPSYPSSRKLAARLGASHTMIGNKLRRHRLPETER